MKRGFKYQQSINLYLDAEEKRKNGESVSCFVIQPKLERAIEQGLRTDLRTFVCSMIIGLVICLIGNIFFILIGIELLQRQ